MKLTFHSKKLKSFLSLIGKDFNQQVVLKFDFKQDKLSIFSGNQIKTFIVYAERNLKDLITKTEGDVPPVLYMPLASLPKSIKLMSQFKKETELDMDILHTPNRNKIEEAVKVEIHSKSFEVRLDTISSNYISAPSDSHLQQMFDVSDAFVSFDWDSEIFATIQDLVLADGKPEITFFSKGKDLWIYGKSFKSKLCENVFKGSDSVKLGIETSYLLTIPDIYNYKLYILGEEDNNFFIFRSEIDNEIVVNYGCGAKI